MQIITETELLDRITAFRERHGMAPTTFGRNATGNANLVRELEEGKSPSLRTAQRIAAYMADVDAEALTRAKLDAPIEPRPEEDQPLPFSSAPVNPTGASSPISSSATARPTARPANGSCPSSDGRAGRESVQTRTSSSADGFGLFDR